VVARGGHRGLLGRHKACPYLSQTPSLDAPSPLRYAGAVREAWGAVTVGRWAKRVLLSYPFLGLVGAILGLVAFWGIGGGVPTVGVITIPYTILYSDVAADIVPRRSTPGTAAI